MSDVRFPHGLPKEYFSSVVTVRIAGGTVRFTPGDPAPEGIPTPAGVITAMNPSRVVDDDTNRRARTALHALLHRRSISHMASVSQAPDGTHVEHGWLVSGVTCDELIMLGRAFGQRAVYWIDTRVDVLACR